MVNFNNFFEFLKTEAEKKGLKKGEWMKLSGMNRTRFSEFDKACSLKTNKKGKASNDDQESKKRNVTPEYFMRLLRGLNMTEAVVQKKSGIKFTEEQRKEIGFTAFLDANKDWFKILYTQPEVFKACKTLADIANK